MLENRHLRNKKFLQFGEQIDPSVQRNTNLPARRDFTARAKPNFKITWKRYKG